MSLEQIQNDITNLRKEVRELTMIVEKLVETTARMDAHIDFVETTYTSVRHPLEWITAKFTQAERLPLPPHV